MDSQAFKESIGCLFTALWLFPLVGLLTGLIVGWIFWHK